MAGIVEKFDVTNQRIYFCDTATGRTAWTREELDTAASPPAGASVAEEIVEKYDIASQRIYFCHTASGRTAWTREELELGADTSNTDATTAAPTSLSHHGTATSAAEARTPPSVATAPGAISSAEASVNLGGSSLGAASSGNASPTTPPAPPMRPDRVPVEDHRQGRAHSRNGTLRTEGHMMKKGAKRRNWTRRWFVLDQEQHMLNYFAEKSAPLSSPRAFRLGLGRKTDRAGTAGGIEDVGAGGSSAGAGVGVGVGDGNNAALEVQRQQRGAIHLDGAEVRPTTVHCELEVHDVAQGRTFCLRAESESEFAQWMRSIKAATRQEERELAASHTASARAASIQKAANDASAHLLSQEERLRAEHARGSRAGNHLIRNQQGGIRRSSMVGALSGTVDDPLSGAAMGGMGPAVGSVAAGGTDGSGAWDGDADTARRGRGDDTGDVVGELPGERVELPTDEEYSLFLASLRDEGLSLVVHPRNGSPQAQLCTMQEVRGRACLTWGGFIASPHVARRASKTHDAGSGRVGGTALPLHRCDVTPVVGAFASQTQRRASMLAPACFFALIGDARGAVFETDTADRRDALVRCFRLLLAEVGQAGGASPTKAPGSGSRQLQRRNSARRLAQAGGSARDVAKVDAAAAAERTRAASDQRLKSSDEKMAEYFLSATNF